MSSEQINTEPSVFKRFGLYLVHLNLYNDDKTLTLAKQLIVTRLYLILLSVCIIVLLTFANLVAPAHTATVISPSLTLFDHLSERYPTTLSCTCSQSVIPYDAFLSFAPQYHDLCSSIFVSESWISTLFSFRLDYYYPLDFRTAASSQFQIIASLCRFAAQSVNDSLQTFSINQLITVSILSRVAFHEQSKAFAQQLQTALITAANVTDEYVALSIAQNYLSSALRTTNFVSGIYGSHAGGSAQYLWDENLRGRIVDFCFCYQTYDCSPKARLYNLTWPYDTENIFWPNMSVAFVPGMKAGCLPHNSILNSTLECFYNATCLQLLMQSIAGATFANPLNHTVQSRFKSNMTVRSMFTELFIEDWHYKSNFTGYFAVCKPVSCSYSYRGNFNAAHMVITFFGLIGGVTIILRFITIFLVKIIIYRVKRICCDRNRPEQEMATDDNEAAAKLSLKAHLIKLVHKAKQALITINLFETSSGVQQDIWSTRVYIVLLILGSSILAIYTSTTLRTISVTVKNPSWADFQQMHTKYSPELSCPCTDISVPYANFMTIQPRFHQVCSSDFVRIDRWLQYFTWNYNPNITTFPSRKYSNYDFRFRAHSHFYVIRTLCQLASKTVTNAITTFNKTEFVTVEPMSEAYFTAQTSLMIQQFVEHTTQSFLALFMFVKSMISGNQLLNVQRTNYYEVEDDVNNSYTLKYYSRIYEDGNNSCSCGVDTICTRPLGIYCSLRTCFDESKPAMIVPGFRIGCLPADALLSSTLECFYNQSCLQKLIDLRTFDLYLFLPFTLDITALSSSAPSRFAPKTKLNTVISQLLIEEWINTTDPLAHYEQCKPTTCTYTYTGRYNVFYVITSILGLWGGLSIILRLSVPFIMKIILKLKRQLFRSDQQSSEELPFGPSSNRRADEVHSQNPIQVLTAFSRRALISLSVFDNEINLSVLPTIIYLFLVAISFSIVLIFAALRQDTHLYTIVLPSESTFELLNARYDAASFSCPCTQVSMPYNTFSSMTPIYHQICSSEFISYAWWKLVWNTGDISNLKDQPLLSTYFRLLSSMCALSKETAKNSTDIFLSSAFISVTTLGRSSFENQVKSAANTVIQETPMTFRRTLQFIREFFRANQLKDLFMSSWMQAPMIQLYDYIAVNNPLSYNNGTCTCATSVLSSCWRPLLFMMSNRTADKLSTTTLPGLVGGCLVIDGLRMSTLECLFDSVCLNTIRELLNSTTVPEKLNISIPTRFSHTTNTLGPMMDELFIEQWLNTFNYSAYYQMCSPRACYYRRSEGDSAVYIITFLLGLYGGLTVTIRLIIKQGWQLSRHLRFTRFENQRRMMRIHPSN